MTELTIPKHWFTVVKCGDPEECARQLLCIIRDEEFEPDEYPAVNINFNSYAACKAVVKCLNEKFYGAGAAQLVLGINH